MVIPSYFGEKLFRDRKDAGRQLARRLRKFRDLDPIVLGLPRGGVPVAYEVAHALGAPLDLCIVRKIGAPIEPELGIGAVAEEDALWLNREAIASVGVTMDELSKLVEEQRAEVEARVHRFRCGQPPIEVRDALVLVVDDGVATGGTARAAIETLRARRAGRIVLAVPVGAASTLEELAFVADEVVCLHPEESFFAVGQWYEDFAPTTDDDVIGWLDRAKAERVGKTAKSQRRWPHARGPTRRNVQVPLGARFLEGQLEVPNHARGLVLFAHGSGSGRRSPRNQFVARELQKEGLATLLFDLLSQEEEVIDSMTGHLRFDVELLASRLAAATDWVRQEPEMKKLPMGYFGASTGAAAAVIAAVERPGVISAIVSRGGRVDLAQRWLDRVKAPTLLIVGGEDPEVLALNRGVFERLGCVKHLETVHGATHLFEEPGALERVAGLAGKWFVRHFGARTLRASA